MLSASSHTLTSGVGVLCPRPEGESGDTIVKACQAMHVSLLAWQRGDTMRQLVIALVVVLTGAYAWAQGDFIEGYAQGDGVRLAFMQAGAGPLIVFLHGHPDDWTLYAAQLREFSHDHLAVAPNLRGYLPSDVPQAITAYTMPHLLNDVHGLLDHFGRDRCVLVGNDWGGYIAWVFASAYPDRVERLVILNAPHPALHLRHVRTDAAQNHA